MTIFKLLLTTLLTTLLAYAQEDDANIPLETKECRERERLVSSQKEDLYSLVDVLEGQTLILRCRFCKEEPTPQPRNWFKVDSLGLTPPHEVQLDMNNDVELNRVSVNFKHSLVIKQFNKSDVGFYYCVHYEDQTNEEKFNYLLDLVLPNKSNAIEKGNIADWSKYHDNFFVTVNNLFKTSEGLEFIYLRDVLKIQAELVTQWGSWGQCQACGRPQGDGLMKKTGLCRIKLSSSGARSKNLTSNEVFLYEAPAISCKSLRLSVMFPLISNYTSAVPDFVLEDRCLGSCNPDSEGVNRGWKVGKGKGFKYRKHSVLEENAHLTLVCPESTLDNKVLWKKNGKTLKRGDDSIPQVIVDTFNTLYLVEVTSAAAGNYTCYVDDIRMLQAVVFVYRFILFLSSFCYCAGLVITWRRRHLFKTYKELKEEDGRKDYEELESFI